MVRLSVNLNAVAQLRNRRDLPWPSVTGIGRICLEAGAAGLTVHPRPDARHIRRGDVFDLAAMLRADWPERELNIEGYPTPDFLALCEEARPDQVSLVPDDPAQATSDHGWDFASQSVFLLPIVARLREQGMRVSLFVDAAPGIAGPAAALGAGSVELFTGPYGNPRNDAAVELKKLVATADACRTAGLALNAGHDLTLDNLPALVAAIPDLAECSIGHALTADALLCGFAEAVRRYRAALKHDVF